MLCKWQQEEVCTGLAYSTQHVVGEDRYQSFEGGGVGTWGCWIPIIAEGGTFTLLDVFNNSDISYTLVAFPCATKPWCTPNFYILKDIASHSINIHGISQKNKWESAKLINGYYVVGVGVISYLGFGVIMNMISKEGFSPIDMLKLATSDCARIWTSQKCVLKLWERKGYGCSVDIFIMCLCEPLP